MKEERKKAKSIGQCPKCKTPVHEPEVEDKTGYTAFYHCKKCDCFFKWDELVD